MRMSQTSWFWDKTPGQRTRSIGSCHLRASSKGRCWLGPDSCGARSSLGSIILGVERRHSSSCGCRLVRSLLGSKVQMSVGSIVWLATPDEFVADWSVTIVRDTWRGWFSGSPVMSG